MRCNLSDHETPEILQSKSSTDCLSRRCNSRPDLGGNSGGDGKKFRGGAAV